MGNQEKSLLLGENFSTATNRLRKNVLFDLLVRHDENVCYRCGELIARPEELSMEHMTPWRTPAQFWDVDNISFSHLVCNVGAGRRTERMKQTHCAFGHPFHTLTNGRQGCKVCKDQTNKVNNYYR